MRKNIALFVVVLLFFVTGNAEVQEGTDVGLSCYEEACCRTNFYAKIFGGANFLQNTSINGNNSSFQPGYIIASSLGYSWYSGLSLEAEYAFRRNAINNMSFFLGGSSKKGHCQVSSYMANLLWDLPLPLWGYRFWNITPFIGAGIGYDFYQMHASNSFHIFDQKWKQFSWQMMAGLSYPLFRNTDMTVEYKFHQGSSHFYNHSIGAALIYKFGLK